MNEQEKIEIQGSQTPLDESKQLIGLFDEMEKKQLDFLDESGKSMIERLGIFLTVLFGVTAFGNSFPPPYLKGNLSAKVLIIVTLIFYLGSMGASSWAIQPRFYRRYSYNVSALGRELKRITERKIFWIRVAGIMFLLGSVALAALIISIIWAI